MQADQAGALRVFEVAAHRVAYVGLKGLSVVGDGVDGVAKSLCLVAAFRRVLDEENDFAGW